MENLENLANKEGWQRGKRWVYETIKCLQNGGYRSPETYKFTLEGMTTIAADFDLLNYFILEDVLKCYKDAATKIREGYYNYLCKMLMTEDILENGFICYPKINKKWDLIYKPAPVEKENNKQTTYKKNNFINRRDLE